MQLADGNLERPIGLLEDILVESCGVQYEHTFAIVEFGQDPNYKLILGRPFMRQLRVIQDWDTDFIYLRHDDVTTRIISLIIHTGMWHELQSTILTLSPQDYLQMAQQKANIWTLLGFSKNTLMSN